MPIVSDAGLAALVSKAPASPVNSKRARYVETAKLLRSATTDDDAADALEALAELAKDN